jgi:hypothetical protein
MSEANKHRTCAKHFQKHHFTWILYNSTCHTRLESEMLLHKCFGLNDTAINHEKEAHRQCRSSLFDLPQRKYAWSPRNILAMSCI